MPEADVAAPSRWLADHEGELLDRFRALLRIPSVESDPLANAPFGRANREALDFMLGLADEWGMRTTDLEGYVGYAEFGEGEPIVMTLGHLDVVPVGPGWTFDPFGATVQDGYVYARGAIDDKGPTIASFYAALALKEVVGGLGVRVRCVFGCNEESGFKCIERYVATEEPPTFGVAPDSGWPVFHGEKGIADLYVERPLPVGPITVLGMEGGQRGNIVIDSFRLVARVDAGHRAAVAARVAACSDGNVVASWDGDFLEVDARGRAAHGSAPHLGDNAATRTFRFLREVSPAEQQAEFAGLEAMAHPDGLGLGISGSDDESGPLTSNLGVVSTVDGRLRLRCNVRYPVTWSGQSVRERCERFLARLDGGYRLADFSDSPPLYFPIDHPLVRAICEVVEEETGERAEPKTMGGGTYARAVPNTVSIGTGWAGDGEAHETDERCAVASLFRMSRIYSRILLRLAQIAR